MKRLALLVLGSMMVAATFRVAAPASAQSTGNDNTAVATNTKDDSYLFKFVFSTGPRPAHLTPEGNRRLAEIRQEYEQLRHSGLPPDQLQARIAELAQEVYQVFTNDLVPAGSPASSSAGTATTTTGVTP